MEEDCIYKAKLIALCEGLGPEAIDELIAKSPIVQLVRSVDKDQIVPPLPIKGE